MSHNVVVVKNVTNAAWILPVLANNGSRQFNPETTENIDEHDLVPNYEQIFSACTFAEDGTLKNAFDLKVVRDDAQVEEPVIQPTTESSGDTISDLSDSVLIESDVDAGVDSLSNETVDERPEHVKLAAAGHVFTQDELKALNADGVREVAAELQVPQGNKRDTIEIILKHFEQLAEMKAQA